MHEQHVVQENLYYLSISTTMPGYKKDQRGEEESYQDICVFAYIATGVRFYDAFHSTARVQLLSRGHPPGAVVL